MEKTLIKAMAKLPLSTKKKYTHRGIERKSQRFIVLKEQCTYVHNIYCERDIQKQKYK